MSTLSSKKKRFLCASNGTNSRNIGTRNTITDEGELFQHFYPSSYQMYNINCKSLEHRHEPGLFYSQICESIHRSSLKCIHFQCTIRKKYPEMRFLNYGKTIKTRQ